MRFKSSVILCLLLPAALTMLGGCGGGQSDVIDLGEFVDGDDAPRAGLVVVDLQPTATVSPTFTAVPPTAVPTVVPTATPFVFAANPHGNLRVPSTVVAVVSLVPGAGQGPEDGDVTGVGVVVEPDGIGLQSGEEEVVTVQLELELELEVDGDGDGGGDGGGDGVGAVVAPELTPLPTPYGQLDSDTGIPVRFLYQAVFPLQTGELPERYLTGEVGDLPANAEFISTTARFVGWVVAYDTLSAGDGWSFEGSVRWVNVTSTLQPFIVYESPVSLETGKFMFFRSLGQSLPGVWKPGWYRVAMLDSQLEEVIGWDFEVR